MPPDGGEYRRTPGGYRYHIPSYIIEAGGNGPNIVRNPPDGGSRTVTVKRSDSVRSRSPATVSPNNVDGNSTGDGPSRPKARKPGRQERLRRRRQAARAADLARAGGDTSVLSTSETVPQQVKSVGNTERAQPDRHAHVTDTASTNTDGDAADEPVNGSVSRRDVTTDAQSAVATGSAATPSTAVLAADENILQPLTVDGIAVPVILVHRADRQPCAHDLYCPEGRQPYCTFCDTVDTCGHLRDYVDELDFEC